MENHGFMLIDNNSFTENGCLNQHIKQLSLKSDEIHISSAFFSNFNDSDDIFSFILENELSIHILIILSQRIGNVKPLLLAFLKNDLSILENKNDQQFVKNLLKLKPDFFILTQDQYNKTRFFHPKLFLFYHKKKCHSAIIGSGNFTSPGINSNIELNFLETQKYRLKEYHKWFSKIMKFAFPLSVRILERIKEEKNDYYDFLKTDINDEEKPLPKSDKDTDFTYPEKMRILNPELGDTINFSTETSNNGSKIKIESVEYFDPEYGLLIEIAPKDLVAWAIGEKENKKFRKKVYLICQKQELLKKTLESEIINPDIHWLIELRNNYDIKPISKTINKDQFPNLEKYYIQILTIKGELIEGKI